tara:strand:+ start:4910 stop:5110 length:201 start_codon:yes stop_codon:yes gene_type:complete
VWGFVGANQPEAIRDIVFTPPDLDTQCHMRNNWVYKQYISQQAANRARLNEQKKTSLLNMKSINKE